MTYHLGRRLVVVAAAAGLVAAAVGSPAYAAPSAASTDGLSVVAVRHSLLGTHTWYQQTYRGLPVLGGFYAVHTDTRTGEVRVQDGRITIGTNSCLAGLCGNPGIQATFARARAESATANRLGGQLIRSELVIAPGAPAKLAWLVFTETARGPVQTVLDAANGTTLSEKVDVKDVNGSGTVFNPNAVVTLQNESLTDSNNQNLAVFGPAYQSVTLTQLNSGVNTLVGAYANNVSKKPVSSATRTYNFNRSQVGFEQVMGYYHITVAQEYIHSLGFTDVNNESQNYRTTGLTADNSFYEPSLDRITFGTGGVDDAEDAEVIWHEYGHAIQDDQVPGFGSGSQAGAIGEGFGDYWAFTMSTPVSANTATTPWACIADWDAVSYTSGTPHCLRRVDGTKVYPGDLDGEVHDDGEIWSRALFDIFNALGRSTTDTVILEAQFNFAPNTSMPSAASQIVATAQALFGSSAANACTTAFQNRGIL